MIENSQLPIGVFDSGVGGLTVMSAVAHVLPDEDLVYLGDTARVPYGNRGADTVRRYAYNAARMLEEEGIKALVVACNTASAYALDLLRTRFSMPVLGVVRPVAERAAAITVSGSVGVVGTRGTVASNCYRTALQELGVRTVTQRACPLFVPLAEEGWTNGAVVDAIAREYLSDFAGSELDTLILGCTHYPILTEPIRVAIEDVVGRDVQLLDSATSTAEALVQTLRARGLARERTTQTAGRTIRFCATDDPDRFRESASRFFGAELDEVEHVDIRDVSMNENCL